MTLYEINEKLKNALQNIDPETGEVLTDLDELEIQRSDLIEGMTLAVKNDSALVDAIMNEVDALLKRAKVLKNGVEWKKRYLGNALIRVNEDGEVVYETFKSARCDLRWRKSASVQIENESVFCEAFPNYCVTKTEVKPDKKLIKAELDKGAKIAGAMIVEKQNLQIK